MNWLKKLLNWLNGAPEDIPDPRWAPAYTDFGKPYLEERASGGEVDNAPRYEREGPAEQLIPSGSIFTPMVDRFVGPFTLVETREEWMARHVRSLENKGLV
jgi:hypothetical protein